MPLTAACAAESVVISGKSMRVARLRAAIPGSRVHVMPGQQHIAMDTAPEQFIAAVVGFALAESNENEVTA